MIVCVAGKNNIAVNVARWFQAKGNAGFQLVGCINQTDSRTDGWQPSFARFCEHEKIQIMDLKDLYDVKKLLFVSVEYDKLLHPDRFVDARLYNVHFSLLPAYKGMFTSAWMLLNGEKIGGATLHEIDKGIDTGNIIDSEQFHISENDQCRTVYAKCLDAGFRVFERNGEKILNGQIESVPQPFRGASYYSKSSIDYSNLSIDFNKTSWEVHNQIRAFSFRDYQLPVVSGYSIFRSEVQPIRSATKPGTVVVENETLLKVATVDFDIVLYKDRLEDLFESARSGNKSRILAIESTGFPIDERNAIGWNILIVATYSGQLDIVRELLERGWDINDRNYKGTTLLMYGLDWFSRTNDREMLQFLLSNGADPESRDHRGLNLEDYAREKNLPEILDLLSEHG